MTSTRLFLALTFLLLISAPAMADPCPGFEAAMLEIEAALPPVPAPVVLIPPHG